MKAILSSRSLLLNRWIGLLWLSSLVALQWIPHTGALRTLFLLIGIVHLVVLSRGGSLTAWPRTGWEGVCLATLTGWLVLQSALIAPHPAVALTVLLEEWGKLALMLALGVVLAVYAVSTDEKWPVLGLLLGYFIHVPSVLGYQAWSLLNNGVLMPGESFLGNYGYVSPFVTGVLAFLLTEMVARQRNLRWLPISNSVLALAVVAALIAQAVLIAKTGVVVVIAMFAVAAMSAGYRAGQRRWFVFFLVGSIAMVAASLIVSNRWSGAAEALATAIHGSPDYSTLTSPTNDPTAPVNRLDNSFYARAVWIKIGLEGIVRHPFGLGFGVDAFGRYVVEQGGPAGAISSHSGWIDFALANGILGLFLLLLLFSAMMRRGWLAFQAGQPGGLACLLFVLHYAIRTALDGHLSGSRLTGFVLVAAALWTWSALAQPRQLSTDTSDQKEIP